MAYKMPLYDEIDVGEKAPFLRQRFYWILANMDQNTIGNAQNCLMIFSDENKARRIIREHDLQYAPALLFWEEIVLYFEKEFSRAIVNTTGQGTENLVMLDICEGITELEQIFTPCS